MEHFSHGRLSMAVHRYGTGSEHLIAFHGFGRTGADFAVFEAALGDRCTIHAFDLPFHGDSPGFPVDEPLEPMELADFVRAYVQQINADGVHLLGYSLGGRFALSLVAHGPQLLRAVFLLAPDGLTAHPWYRALADYPLGRAVYRGFIDHPAIPHGMAHLLYRAHLISAKLHRFVIDSSATREQRTLLHDVWGGFRKIEPHLEQVVRQARQYGLPIHILLGEHDRVIPPKRAAKLEQLAPTLVQVHLQPTGHRMLGKHTGAVLADLLEKDRTAGK